MRTRFLLLAAQIALFFVCGVAVSAQTQTASPIIRISPSFDCTKSNSPFTDLICKSPELSREELTYTQIYYALRYQVGEMGWPVLNVEAANFQKSASQQCQIPAAGALPPDTLAMELCLSDAFWTQRAAWWPRLKGAAVEEASRPMEQHIALQLILQALGFLPSTAKADGVYGADTRTAILAWQQSKGVSGTGFIGDQDAKFLGKNAPQALSALFPPDIEIRKPASGVYLVAVTKLNGVNQGSYTPIAHANDLTECTIMRKQALDHPPLGIRPPYTLAWTCMTDAEWVALRTVRR